MASNDDMDMTVPNGDSGDTNVVENTIGQTESTQHEQPQAITTDECLIRCGHLCGVGECAAELKCMVSKYIRHFQFALPLSLEREKELEFELAVHRMQRSGVASSGSTAQNVVTNQEAVTAVTATNPSAPSTVATDANAADPERDPETFRKALDTWRAASLRQKAFANKKADLMKLKTKFKPGQLSPALRSALGLKPDELPVHIYRMRVLGYPPAWLQRALVQPEARDDPDGSDAHSRQDGRRKPAKYYNIRKIIEFPGYNVYPPKDVHDEHRRFDVPHLRRSALMWNYVADLNGESSSRAREYRKMCERRGESGNSDDSFSDDESQSESEGAIENEAGKQSENAQPSGTETEKNGESHNVAAASVIGTTRSSLEEGELDDSEFAGAQPGGLASNVADHSAVVESCTTAKGHEDAATCLADEPGEPSQEPAAAEPAPAVDVVSRVSSFLIESSTYDLSRLFHPEDEMDGDDNGSCNGDSDTPHGTTEADTDRGERKCVTLPDSVPDLSKFAVSIEPYEAWNVADPTARLEQITGLIKSKAKRSRKPRAACHTRRATVQEHGVTAERSPSPGADRPVSGTHRAAHSMHRSLSIPANSSHSVSNSFPFSQPIGNFNNASFYNQTNPNEPQPWNAHVPFGNQYDYTADTYPNFHGSTQFDERTSSTDRAQHRRRDRDRRSRSRSHSRSRTSRRHSRSRSRSPHRRRHRSRSNSPRHQSRR